ncbi:hypothetical protein HPP92_002868 [Vanilla planifolia]|uniref:Uncharacterized protein n=1 Tax=Vanilla planifolia TaxID=51239 RepID=A0A835VN52_VANPL|nr:hypothetical protein HPP92_002868 [Vanilla planifolia]
MRSDAATAGGEDGTEMELLTAGRGRSTVKGGAKGERVEDEKEGKGEGLGGGRGGSLPLEGGGLPLPGDAPRLVARFIGPKKPRRVVGHVSSSAPARKRICKLFVVSPPVP